MNDDAYVTLKRSATVEIKVKGSRFLGFARSVDTRAEAEGFVKEIAKKYHDATHNCFAYRVGVADNSEFRFSDDGEPSGTAGRPILEAVDGRSLTNIVCAVTRYFGGTKLGTGGLARAYGECAAAVLDRGGRETRYKTGRLRIVFPYKLMGSVMKVVSIPECRVEETIYGDTVEMILVVRLAQMQVLRNALIDTTRGKARFTE